MVSPAGFAPVARPPGIDAGTGSATVGVALGGPVEHPLPTVAGDVVESVRVRRSGADGEGAADRGVSSRFFDAAAPSGVGLEHGPFAGRRLLAPRVGPAVGSAGGAFPLGLRRESLALGAAIGAGVVPIDAVFGLKIAAEIGVPGFGFGTVARCDAGLVCADRHFVPVEIEGLDPDLFARSSSLRAVVRSADEPASGDANHLGTGVFTRGDFGRGFGRSVGRTSPGLGGGGADAGETSDDEGCGEDRPEGAAGPPLSPFGTGRRIGGEFDHHGYIVRGDRRSRVATSPNVDETHTTRIAPKVNLNLEVRFCRAAATRVLLDRGARIRKPRSDSKEQFRTDEAECESRTRETMRAKNPKNGEIIAEYPTHTEKEIEQKVMQAREDFREWREVDFEDRASLMAAAATVLRENVETYGRRMTDEMGKPIAEARSEIEKCAWVCEHYAEQAEEYLAPREIETDASTSYVRYEPLGPIVAVMPWNFPFWQVFRFAAPNLMAGNVGLLSHASNVPGCAESIEEVFLEAGFPKGAFQNVVATDEQTTDLIVDRRIRGVAVTGSVGAGRAVASAAGEQVKPSVLELGGSDPFVVLEDCEFEYTVEQAVRTRTLNSGQSCIAGKRFVVEDGIYERFVDAFEERLADLEMGDPLEESTDVGPIAREDLRETLHRQVRKTIAAGATCRLGGELPEGPGFFYPPTLLVDVETSMTAFEEETFGPVAAVIRAEDADEAVRLANRTTYGLGASVWTERDRGERLARRLEAGCVAVNGIVKSDPRLPFGGIKDSGYGRELGREGIVEFVNKKSVWIR